jgi:genome maintenance exonuclease 1
MLIEKFQYKDLSRKQVDGKRLYSTPDGNAVPSVTTILSATQPKEKQEGLARWRKRVGTHQAQAITTEAANRGTRMHTYLENYCIDGTIKERGNNPFSWQSHAMAETVIREGMCYVDDVWGVEVYMFFPGIYAGTTDLVGVHNGEHAIMDFKQSNKPKKVEWIEDYKLQLCAYAEAHNEVYGTKIRKGVVLMCVKPDVDEMGHLKTEPQYQEFIVEGDEFEHWRQQWWKRVEQYYVAS